MLATTTHVRSTARAVPRRETRRRVAVARASARDGDAASAPMIAASLACVMLFAPPAHALSFGKGASASSAPAAAPAAVAKSSSGPNGAISANAKSYGGELSADVDVDYDAASSKTYNVRETYAKSAPKEYKRFVRPVREEAAATPKKESDGGGFALPSFSLPSFSLPSIELPDIPDFGGGDDGEAAEEAPAAE